MLQNVLLLQDLHNTKSISVMCHSKAKETLGQRFSWLHYFIRKVFNKNVSYM